MERQLVIKKLLDNSNCDSIEGLFYHSKMFIEKMVLLSLTVFYISNQLQLKSLSISDARETFIVLIFLASGKFVSAKTYDLAKERMKKKSGSFEQLSTSTTLKSIKLTKRSNKEMRHSEM